MNKENKVSQWREDSIARGKAHDASKWEIWSTKIKRHKKLLIVLSLLAIIGVILPFVIIKTVAVFILLFIVIGFFTFLSKEFGYIDCFLECDTSLFYMLCFFMLVIAAYFVVCVFLWNLFGEDTLLYMKGISATRADYHSFCMSRSL